MNIESISLEGKFVRLDPLRIDHIPALFDAAKDPALWEWTTVAIDSAMDMERYVREALAARERDECLPFVIVGKESGKIVGSTRFGAIDRHQKKAEIGWTWIATEFQRTAVNTETKLLMLTHAFEIWKAIRVEFKTDANNEKSIKALKRIGAKKEGVFRNHMITRSGRIRDSVYFSIIDKEWESIKADLASKLAKKRTK